MQKLSQHELIELKKSLIKKIQLLQASIKQLPAYPRRKKDEENRQSFSTAFLLAAFLGIVIFSSGWLLVAASLTILSVAIVESGLYLSIALGFIGKPLFSSYLWLRDVLSSEKIKNQNKDFDQMDNQLRELEKLAAKVSFLMTRIDYQLNDVCQWLPSKLVVNENTEFKQLSLKEQIIQLEQIRRKLPAYARRKKDQQVSDKINECWKYYSLGLLFIGIILMLTLLLYPPITLLVTPTMALLFIPMALTVAFGPILASNIANMTYLFIRDLFSPAAVKTENKQLTQLEKAIDKLIDLENQLKHIAKAILNKLEPVDISAQSDVKLKHTEKGSLSGESNNFGKRDNFEYKAMFQEVPANQTVNSTNTFSASI